MSKTITIPKTRFDQFRFDPNSGLRYGQAFHQFMGLEKITSNANREWCDKLYNANDNQARNMVKKVIDPNN